MSVDEIKKQIRLFLSDYLDPAALDDAQGLFSSGLVTSLFAMKLVLFVEEQFEISVETEDLSLATFDNITSIANLVMRKLA